MKFLTLSNHQLATVTSRQHVAPNAFVTGLPMLDALVPGGFSNGVMHEILVPPHAGKPKYFAMLLAKAAMKKLQSVDCKGQLAENVSQSAMCNSQSRIERIAWCDPRGELWPAAMVGNGIPLDQLLILRPRKPADELWAMAECLRCRAIKVTIGMLDRLTQVEARRLQLAAERGGGMGILLRPYSAASTTYAASTRWLVCPAPGDEQFQRWKIQLIHGQGGLVGRTILLEANREANLVRASEIVADRPAETKITSATG